MLPNAPQHSTLTPKCYTYNDNRRMNTIGAGDKRDGNGAYLIEFHIQKRKKSNVAEAWYETSPLLIGHTGLAHPSQRIHKAGMALQQA